jgi:hypothetical protein
MTPASSVRLSSDAKKSAQLPSEPVSPMRSDRVGNGSIAQPANTKTNKKKMKMAWGMEHRDPSIF